MPLAKLQLGADVTLLKGVSSQRAKLLAKFGIRSVGELIQHVPRAYEDWHLTPRTEWQDQAIVNILAEVESLPILQRRGRLSWLKFRVRSRSGESLAITYFNQSWLQKTFQLGESYIFHGSLKRQGQFYSLANPLFRAPALAEAEPYQAVYRSCAGLTQKLWRQWQDEALSRLDFTGDDPLPLSLRGPLKLAEQRYVWEKIHKPQSEIELELARHRLAFEELFFLRAAFKLMKASRLRWQKAPRMQTVDGEKGTAALLERIRRQLAFVPTGAQIRAVNDILRDLRSEHPMNRLLEGDVGSGKTLVAALAMAYAAADGYQSVLMAPTSILAWQHVQSLERLYEGTGLRLGLLSGQLTAAERRQVLKQLAAGELDVLVGTHALLEKDVQFSRLGLTITDEQHRFGVKQRLALAEGEMLWPHRLVMSATPIPRTLALILYGDLDLSVLDELPRGRQPIRTEAIRRSDLPRIYSQLEQELAAGGQAYVICPLIEDSENLSELESAETVYRSFVEEIFPQRRIGLLHGALKSQEKDELMRAFLAAELDVLVSTTVVEVGVDNPRANFMLILGAERFGLAQLHQLRGRVGRGQKAARCYLCSDAEDDLARQRLAVLSQCSSGFELAEADLRLRGPGDFFGTRQHGLPEFRLLNLYSDLDILQEADWALTQLFPAEQGDETLVSSLNSAEKERLLAAITQRYPELMQGFTL